MTPVNSILPSYLAPVYHFNNYIDTVGDTLHGTILSKMEIHPNGYLILIEGYLTK